jgi:hypothetical protein
LRTNPLKLKQHLIRKVYQLPALPPSNPRIDPVIPATPARLILTARNDSIRLSWEKSSDAKNYVVYKLRKGSAAVLSGPESVLCITPDTEVIFKATSKTRPSRYYYAVTSQSFTNSESKPVFSSDK